MRQAAPRGLSVPRTATVYPDDTSTSSDGPAKNGRGYTTKRGGSARWSDDPRWSRYRWELTDPDKVPSPSTAWVKRLASLERAILRMIAEAGFPVPVKVLKNHLSGSRPPPSEAEVEAVCDDLVARGDLEPVDILEPVPVPGIRAHSGEHAYRTVKGYGLPTGGEG